MIPAVLDAHALEAAAMHDPVVQQYRRLFAGVDWTQVPERARTRVYPGPVPHPRVAFIKALVVKLVERRSSAGELRTFLLAHPVLVWELGFRLVADSTQPWGIDIARTLPSDRWLRHQQQALDEPALEAVLHATVRRVQERVPALGETVAIDATHIVAHVRENNPNQSMRNRFDPARRPSGDPDCRLGVKVTANQAGRRREKRYLYGDACGIAATIVAVGERGHDLVLATHTIPLNCQDIAHFRPLYDRVTITLGAPPTNLTADAAFDAWSVYAPCVATGGMAAIAPNRRSPGPARSSDGHPICATNRVMTPSTTGRHQGHRVQYYRCPLQGTDQTCAHSQFAKGGCRKRINSEPGGLLRAAIDRSTPAYSAIYRQRTCVERVNSRAKARGLEHPFVRSLAAVTRQVLLTAITLNLQTIAIMFPDLHHHAT